MVAEKKSRFVPASYLEGASCPLPDTAAGGRDGRMPSWQDRPFRSVGLALPASFTPAERQVSDLVCQGLSNKEIAAALGRAHATVRHQLSSAMRKLGVPSRCGLIVRLLRG